jgi:hypothetical protein
LCLSSTRFSCRSRPILSAHIASVSFSCIYLVLPHYSLIQSRRRVAVRCAVVKVVLMECQTNYLQSVFVVTVTFLYLGYIFLWKWTSSYRCVILIVIMF